MYENVSEPVYENVSEPMCENVSEPWCHTFRSRCDPPLSTPQLETQEEKVWNARPNPSLCATPSGPNVTVCALPDEARAKAALPARTVARIQRRPNCFKV
jgi:hypothetical protein